MIDTPPAEPPFALPDETVTGPDAPAREDPVPISTSPDEPVVASPVRIFKDPLSVLPSAEVISIAPLLPPADTPLVT
jgi:hypothetical protein